MKKYTYRANKNAPKLNRAGRRSMMLVPLTRLCPMPFIKVWGPMLWVGASFWRRIIITREQRCICCAGKEGEGETSGKQPVLLNGRQKAEGQETVGRSQPRGLAGDVALKCC